MSRKPEIEEPFDLSVDYGYGPAQWAAIRRDLYTKLKIDVAKTIQFVEPWNDQKPVTCPLSDALQELAGYYGALARLENHQLTPKQQAMKANQMLTKLKASPAGELADLILELERRKQRYDKLAATHNSRRDNAIRTHTRFWLVLMNIWRSLDEAGQQHKHLRDFLFICSKPVFAKATTEKTLTAFVERYSRKQTT
jgi:hypothetical protein